MRVSGDEFWSIISAAKSIKKISFQWWEITTDSKWSFSDMEEWQIMTINFYRSGLASFSNWTEYPERLENIVYGIWKCSELRNCLEELLMHSWGLTKDQISKIQNKYKLKSILFLA